MARVGRGKVGHGDRFARARLALARRAGYLGDVQLPSGPGGASAMWRDTSRNLATNAREAGYANPLQWLRDLAAARAGAMTGTGLQVPTEDIGAQPLASPFVNKTGSEVEGLMA